MGNTPNSFSLLSIQYHYNNPDGDMNKIDTSSGVKIYCTNQQVQSEIGIAVMGDSNISKDGSPLGDGETQHIFMCNSECTSVGLGDIGKVTVMEEALHMHTKGEMVYCF